MRCIACDANLSDFESSRRSTSTGDYLDLCSGCFAYIQLDMDTTENFVVFDPNRDDLTTPVAVEGPQSRDNGSDADEPSEES